MTGSQTEADTLRAALQAAIERERACRAALEAARCRLTESEEGRSRLREALLVSIEREHEALRSLDAAVRQVRR